MITKEQLIKIFKCPRGPVEAHYPSLTQAMESYLIDTPDRVSAFLANVLHETGMLKRFTENLMYSEAGLLATFPTRVTPTEARQLAKNPVLIANHVYANRHGNTEPGDGWKYRGRGMFQTTFKDNYEALSQALGFDFVKDPDKVSEPPYAAKSAAYYWKSRGLNSLADKGDLMGITRKINGGTHGHDKRLALFHTIRGLL